MRVACLQLRMRSRYRETARRDQPASRLLRDPLRQSASSRPLAPDTPAPCLSPDARPHRVRNLNQTDVHALLILTSATPICARPISPPPSTAREQASVLWRFERFDPVAFQESLAVRFLGWSIRNHHPALVPSGTLASGTASTGVIPSK